MENNNLEFLRTCAGDLVRCCEDEDLLDFICKLLVVSADKESQV